MVSQSACEGTKFSDLVILYDCYFSWACRKWKSSLLYESNDLLVKYLSMEIIAFYVHVENRMIIGSEFKFLLSPSCTLFTMILDELHIQNVKKKRGAILLRPCQKVSFGNEFHLSFGVIYYVKNKERMYN